MTSWTYLKRSGKSQPAISHNLAFGESSPGRPLKRTSCSFSSLSSHCLLRTPHIGKRGNAPVDLRLPLLHFFPSFLVQEIVDLHHGLDLIFRSFPSLPDQRVVKLLWRWVFPTLRGIARYRRCSALSGKIEGLRRCALLRKNGEVI